MSNRNRYPALQLRGKDYKTAENRREPGDPLRQIVFVDTDYSCFKKSAEERLRLKLAKAQEKQEKH
jgi:hypothetical protein